MSRAGHGFHGSNSSIAAYDGWTDRETITCPVCGATLEVKVYGPKAQGLKEVIGCAAFCAVTVGIGALLIPGIKTTLWKVIAAVGLYGLGPLTLAAATLAF